MGEGKIAMIAIDDPVEQVVNATAVSAAMDAIVTQNVFTSSGGDFVSKVSTRVVGEMKRRCIKVTFAQVLLFIQELY